MRKAVMRNIFLTIAVSILFFAGGMLSFLFLPHRVMAEASPKTGVVSFVYGNRQPVVQGLKRAWGFSALIQYDDKTILFNTAGQEKILKNNFEVLGISPRSLDAVVISHHHWEMINGLGFIMEENPEIPVYTTETVIKNLLRENPQWASNFHQVDTFEEYTPNILFQNLKSSRRHGGPRGIYEVHVILKTDKGLVIFLGCGHPQILRIVQASKALADTDQVHLIAGGTRLLRPNNHIIIEDSGEDLSIRQKNYYTDEYYAKLMADLKQEGVEYVMPTHCTLEPAEEFFRQAFGDRYINHTLGMRLEFPLVR